MHDRAHRVTGSMPASTGLPRCGIEIEPPTGQLVFSGSAYVVAATTFPVCACCGGRGVIVPKVDDATLVSLIADVTFCSKSFTVSMLFDHAEVVGDPLQAALAEFSRGELGRTLERIADQDFDGLTIKRIGLDRRRVALWCIAPAGSY